MKKIIRLTERDLIRMVKRVVNESHDNYITCSDCDGEGMSECPECGGYGEDKYGDICDTCNGDETIECKNCDGTGEDDCYTCGGFGKYQSWD